MEGESKYDCLAADIAIPGLRVCPDCNSASQCTVCEFKPGNGSAKAAGERQMESYAKEVARITSKMLAERYKSYRRK